MVLCIQQNDYKIRGKVRMRKQLRSICSLLLAGVMLASSITDVNAAYGYCGIKSMSGSWTERSGFLWLNKDTYKYTATYSSSFITLLYNMSGTKYWGNYGNANATAQKMEIGISKTTTVGETKAYKVSAEVGLQVPVKAATVSGKIGGDYSNSKTYQKTIGTNSAYTIDTKSKNGYYAVEHAINCDAYKVSIKKNGSSYSSGQLIRYESHNGYEMLYYSKSSF